jgi:hypothetical protein
MLGNPTRPVAPAPSPYITSPSAPSSGPLRLLDVKRERQTIAAGRPLGQAAGSREPVRRETPPSIHGACLNIAADASGGLAATSRDRDGSPLRPAPVAPPR